MASLGCRTVFKRTSCSAQGPVSGFSVRGNERLGCINLLIFVLFKDAVNNWLCTLSNYGITRGSTKIEPNFFFPRNYNYIHNEIYI